jgi:hypothetical protein
MRSKKSTACWKQHVQAFQKSGVTRQAYCEQNDIKVFQLDYWRKKFAAVDGEQSPPEWIPIRIKETEEHENAGSICMRIARLEIEVKRGFDRELLLEVLRVVGLVC